MPMAHNLAEPRTWLFQSTPRHKPGQIRETHAAPGGRNKSPRLAASGRGRTTPTGTTSSNRALTLRAGAPSDRGVRREQIHGPASSRAAALITDPTTLAA